MERITGRLEDGRARVIDLDSISNPDKLYELINRLAAYEDTGLTPEKIKEHEAAYIEITTMTYGPLHQKIGQWLRADREGQLVVLPCKLGDTVWYIDSCQEICEAEVTNIELNIYTMPQMWMTIKYWSKALGVHECNRRIDLMLGKTVFLTREAAEAALKGGEEDA